MTDDLLDKLAADLKPVRPMRLRPLWLMAAVGLAATALFVILVYGPRPEMAALARGVWPEALMIVAKPLIFLGIGLSALGSLGGLIRPQGRLNPLTLMPAVLLGLLVLLLAIAQYVGDGPAKTLHSLQGGNNLCFATVAGGGLIGFGLLWALWLRRAASASPAVLGALSGLATASLAATAYAIHCNMDAPAYLLLVYGVAVGLITALAAFAGKRLFRW